MNTLICYFSGTGNSLSVARKLQSLLGGQASILPIRKDSRKLNIIAERLILVYPVYFQTIPRMLKMFLNKLEFPQKTIDIVAVATCNGGPGHSLFTVDRILKKRGQSLRAGYAITMPGNSVIIRDYTNPPEVRAQRLEESIQRMEEIAQCIRSKQSDPIGGDNSFLSHFRGLVTGTVAKYLYRTPSRFKTSDACTKCATCIRVCPASNIQLINGAIRWGSSCEHCLACFHWCPAKAIELSNSTVGKLRYHHPDVSIHDMFHSEWGKDG